MDLLNIQYRALEELIPYANNAKQHPERQIANIAESIRRYGFRVPILVDGSGVIIAGHGRCLAAKAAGLTEVPVLIADDMSEEDVRAYRILDNKLSESPWDIPKLKLELPHLDLSGFDLPSLSLGDGDGGEDGEDAHFWGDVEGESNEEYEAFVEKFTPKLTTDDCYTPANIYEAAKSWAVNEYGLEGCELVRPFYPGGDYERYHYPENCVVLDNPPFSILSKICEFYTERGIRYFLFAPALSLFATFAGKANYVPCYNQIIFDNGARIGISFVTNMGEYKLTYSPELSAALNAADAENRAKLTADLPKYDYPDCVVTGQTNKLSRHGIPFRVKAEECQFVRALDSQREAGKAIFGGGFLLSEKAAAEKAAATVWPLSERELEIQRGLGK